LLQGGLNTANANIASLIAVNLSQNTYTQAAFDKANTGAPLSGYLANSVIFANTTGYLSNSSSLQFNTTASFANLTFASNANIISTGKELAFSVVGDQYTTPMLMRIQNRDNQNGALFENPATSGYQSGLLDFGFKTNGGQRTIRYETRSGFTILSATGNEFQFGNTGNPSLVTNDSVVLVNTAGASISNTTGAFRVNGGVGIKGNVYSGGIYITGTGNGITFVDGTVQTTNAASFAYSVAAFDKANSANTLAQSAFNKANTGAPLSGYLANSVIFANTTGYLSNSSSLQLIPTATGANLVLSGSQYANLVFSANSSTSNGSSSIITSGKELVLGQTGDAYGPTYLRMVNGFGQNGAIFDSPNAGTPLIDFIFKTTITQRNIRFETRGGGNKYVTGGDGYEFQIGIADTPTLITSNNATLVYPNTASTSNTTGAFRVNGGAGIQGNVYSGGIYITGSGNGITFVDGTKQTTNAAPFAYTQAAFDKANTAANSVIQNAQSTTYSLTTSDAGKYIYYTQSANVTLYIPNSGSVPFINGSTIMVVSKTSSSANVTITPNTGVSLYLVGNTTSQSRNVTTYGMATLFMAEANTWFINGTGVV
jgi:hypothetical protein